MGIIGIVEIGIIGIGGGGIVAPVELSGVLIRGDSSLVIEPSPLN